MNLGIASLFPYMQQMQNMQGMQGLGYAMGGMINGPGTGTSDSIPAMIYQDGKPVQEARLSNNEFVFTEKAVKCAGGPAAMYEMMNKYEAMA